MTVNLAFRGARQRARLSQYDLARRVREEGFAAGDPNGCTRSMVQRWETKGVRPQPRYLMALEGVLGQPAENLGFADATAGADRERALADAGLDADLPLPEPAATYGPLTGIWVSEYVFESSSRGRAYSNRHHVLILQRGARLMVRSLPASRSRLSLTLSVNGHVVTGTWTEQTAADGYYKGAVYFGSIQMMLEQDDRKMAGKWVGFGKEGEINVGPWSLELITGSVAPESIREHDKKFEPPA